MRFRYWTDVAATEPGIRIDNITLGGTLIGTAESEEGWNAITLHHPADGTAGTVASKPAQPVFDDTRTWWFKADEHGATGSHPGRYQPGWYSVDVPKTGTTIRVVGTSKQGNSFTVLVAPK